MTNATKSIKLNELMEAAFKKVANGKELKYFWSSADEVTVETRNDLIRTLCRLAAAKEEDEMLEASSGKYPVNQYSIPNHEWLQTLVNFSGHVYMTPVQKRRQKWMDITVRPNDWSSLPGKTLTPGQLKDAFKVPGEYNNAWETTGEISKDAVKFGDLHGAYVGTDGEYLVFDSTKDALYAQILGLTINDLDADYGASYDVLETQSQLVTAMKTGNEEE